MTDCKDKKCNITLLRRKLENKCLKCGEIFCAKHIYFYVDESNESITKNSAGWCRNCYPYNH